MTSWQSRWRHDNRKQSASAREHWCDVSCDIPYYTSAQTNWYAMYSLFRCSNSLMIFWYSRYEALSSFSFVNVGVMSSFRIYENVCTCTSFINTLIFSRIIKCWCWQKTNFIMSKIAILPLQHGISLSINLHVVVKESEQPRNWLFKDFMPLLKFSYCNLKPERKESFKLK